MSVARKVESNWTSPSGWRGGPAAVASEILDQGIAEGGIDGAVVLAARYGSYTVQLSRGRTGLQPDVADRVPVDFTSVFDLGSVTETVCTATLLMRLVSSGKIGLHDRASRYVQSLAVGPKSRITIAHLLSHSAGFGAASHVYDVLSKANSSGRPGILASSGARHFAYRHLHHLPLKHEPGAKQIRSEVNYITLGEVCEIVTGLPLERAFSRLVAAPLRLRNMHFIDGSALRCKTIRPVKERFVPIGECPRRGGFLCGDVWDETAWAMGGIAGHNGLFGTADDLLVWGSELLAALKGRSDILSQEAVREFLRPTQNNIDPQWRFGFEGLGEFLSLPDGECSPEAVVIASATGCALVIEPKQDLVAVVMTSGGLSEGISKRYASMRANLIAALSR